MLHEIPADVLHMLLQMLQKLPPLSAGADMRAWHRGCAAHRHGHEPHARRGGKELVSESRDCGASDGPMARQCGICTRGCNLAKLFLVAKILHTEAPYFPGRSAPWFFGSCCAMRVPPDIAGLSQAVRGPRALPDPPRKKWARLQAPGSRAQIPSVACTSASRSARRAAPAPMLTPMPAPAQVPEPAHAQMDSLLASLRLDVAKRKCAPTDRATTPRGSARWRS